VYAEVERDVSRRLARSTIASLLDRILREQPLPAGL
jgi:hypothetical protein